MPDGNKITKQIHGANTEHCGRAGRICDYRRNKENWQAITHINNNLIKNGQWNKIDIFSPRKVYKWPTGI